MLLRMAIRNIMRQKRRTFLTLLMMVCGFILMSFSLAFVSGTYDEVIDLFTERYVGHAQAHSRKYVEIPSINHTLQNYPELIKNIEKNKNIKSHSIRIKAGALASFGNKTFGAEVYGVDFHKENKTTALELRIAHGRLPIASEVNAVAIGAKLARILNVALNNELVLISQGADGSVANDLFKITGIFEDGQQSRDDYRIYMNLQAARQFYTLPESGHEVSLVLKDKKILNQLNSSLDVTAENILQPWQEIEKDFYRAMQADKKGNDVSFFIIMFIVGLGVFNTILMATLERTREFGVMKAIGTTPLNIATLISLEVVIMSFLSIVIGCLIATCINFYFTIYGLSIGEGFTYGGVYFGVLHAKMTWQSYWVPSLIIMTTAFIVSLYPGIKAAKISPIQALREF